MSGQPAGYQAVGYQQSGYPAAGYPGAPGYPVYSGYPVPVSRPTNGASIAALVVSCVGVVGLCAYGLGGWIGTIGAIIGHVARRQIRDSGDNGDGMALAGIIVGWIATGLFVVAAVIWGFVIYSVANHPEDFEQTLASLINLLVG